MKIAIYISNHKWKKYQLSAEIGIALTTSLLTGDTVGFSTIAYRTLIGISVKIHDLTCEFTYKSNNRTKS